MNRKRMERPVTVRLAADEHEWLSRMAERDDRTLSSYIRKLIREHREAELKKEKRT